MCRLLFDAPKVNDALLFMTILSTDLRALRRRGYNGMSPNVDFSAMMLMTWAVDRILRQQKADRQAAEEAVKAKQAAILASQGVASASSDTLVSDAPKPNGTRPGSPLFNEKESAPLPPIPAGAPSAVSDELTKQPSRPMSMVRQSLDAVKRRLQKDNGGPSNAPLGPSQEEDTPSDQLPLLPPRPNRPLTPQPHATPRSSICEHLPQLGLSRRH